MSVPAILGSQQQTSGTDVSGITIFGGLTVGATFAFSMTNKSANAVYVGCTLGDVGAVILRGERIDAGETLTLRNLAVGDDVVGLSVGYTCLTGTILVDTIAYGFTL